MLAQHATLGNSGVSALYASRPTATLAELLKGEARSRRQQAAREILGAVLSDTPSIEVQGELVAEALHLKPEKLRRLKPDKALSKVEGKLASW